MLEIKCSGTPYEIGLAHGTQAQPAIHRCLAFYRRFFADASKFTWPQARTFAADFEARIRANWPAYLDEMRGVADGAHLDLLDVIALNVRTEIAFGTFAEDAAVAWDGCTAVAWATGQRALLAQNWDWTELQKENLISLDIEQAPKPRVKMVTEAGIIGKIGLNDRGVGVTLNAIRALGMDAARMPCHLALRAVLDSTSTQEARRVLEAHGVASACHITIADTATAVGAECSAADIRFLQADAHNRLLHSNHYLEDHPGVTDTVFVKDSLPRLERIGELCAAIPAERASIATLGDVLKDEQGAPCAINRTREGSYDVATVFSIVMDLTARRAEVAVGRPSVPDERVTLAF